MAHKVAFFTWLPPRRLPRPGFRRLLLAGVNVKAQSRSLLGTTGLLLSPLSLLPIIPYKPIPLSPEEHVILDRPALSTDLIVLLI